MIHKLQLCSSNSRLCITFARQSCQLVIAKMYSTRSQEAQTSLSQSHLQHSSDFPRCQNKRMLTWKAFRKNPDPKKDGVGPDGQLVFSNNNKFYLHSAYIALCVCAGYMCVSAMVIYYNYQTGSLPTKIDADHPVVFVTLGNVLGLSLLVLTRILMKRSLFRIYYYPSMNQFEGIEYRWNMTKNNVKFSPEDVQILESVSFFRELKGNIQIKQKPYYLPLKDFKNPAHYNIMVGNIKPENYD